MCPPARFLRGGRQRLEGVVGRLGVRCRAGGTRLFFVFSQAVWLTMGTPNHASKPWTIYDRQGSARQLTPETSPQCGIETCCSSGSAARAAGSRFCFRAQVGVSLTTEHTDLLRHFRRDATQHSSRSPRRAFSPPNGLPITSNVALSRRQRRTIGRELRDLVFRVCSGGGAFIGLMWALKHTNTNSRASTACKPHGAIHGHVATHAFAQCVGSSLASGILAWIIPVLVGAGVGAVVGLLLASSIRLGRASKPAAAVGVTAGRWIRARYSGNCEKCGCSIVPGDRICHSPGLTLCASCGEHQ
jgi:hypothetical protein